MTSVRVLHVLHSMNCGGAETLLMHLYRGMDRDKVQFDFLVNVFDEMFYEKEIEELGGRIWRMPFLTQVTPPVYTHKLRAFFREKGYPIVHSHLETTTGLILREAKRAGVPVRIAHSHNSRFTRSGITALPENAFKAYCRRKIVPNATKLYSCSELAAAWLYGKHAGESTLLRNGVDASACAFDPEARSEARAEWGVADDETLFGHVGRFNDQKNHVFLIDTFRAFLSEHPDSRLLLAGEGDLMPQMRERASDLGDRVLFAGLRRDVPRLLSGMDCFLLPSKFEGLPLVLVEAQAAGLPCLVSDTVSHMSDLGTGAVRFLPLREADWTKAMAKPMKRVPDAAAIVAAKGYDSRLQAQQLQAFYLESVGAV